MSNVQLAISNDSQPRKMKYSGVEWIGDIPADWTISRLKDIKADVPYAIVDGPFGSAISTDDYVENGIPLVRIVNISQPGLTVDNIRYITEKHAETVKRSSTHLGDIIFAKTGATVGKCGINDQFEYAILSSSCVKISIDSNHSNRYFYYFFCTDQFNEALRNACNGTTRDTINLKPFANIFCCVPILIEQQSIADILDRKCTQIDALIANEEQQIAKLKAYKQSVITETVTKGLNPDVPMKDSGVEWIGEIPEQWNVAPISRLANLYNGDRSSNYPSGTDIVDNGILFVTSNNLDSIKLNTNVSNNKYITEEKYNSLRGAKLKMNDIVFCLRGSVGKCGINYMYNAGTIASSLVCIRAKSILPSFLNYMLHTSVVVEQAKLGAIGIGSQNLAAEDIARVIIPIPIAEEQQQIADYLDQKCEQIDRLIAIKQQKIEKLQQYKKSVIYEYVTGKRESVDTNVVFFNPLTAKALLLCKIIDFLGDQLRGRIQALKCLFLIEDCVGINFNTQYFRFKHGPYTPDIVNIEKCCMENEWLTVSIVNNHYEYHIGNNHCYYSDKYDKIFGTNNSEIEKVLSFIKGMKTSEVERVATLFAVWNDMIIAGTNSPSDSEIIFEVRNNWTPNKANSPVSTWQNTLDKMRKAGITPKGYGLHTMKKENENEQL